MGRIDRLRLSGRCFHRRLGLLAEDWVMLPADEYRKEAERIRKSAMAATGQEMAVLLDIARLYDKLARQAETSAAADEDAAGQARHK